MRRPRAAGALAVALALSAYVAGAADGSTHREVADRPPAGGEAACVREGLAPIPIVLGASAIHDEGVGAPKFTIRWSGEPLAAECEAHRVVAVEFTIWFPHLRFVFTEGFPSPWLQFWDGRKAVRNEEESYVSNASYRPLGCVRKARARLRYEVISPGGAVLGRRVVRVPVKHHVCRG